MKYDYDKYGRKYAIFEKTDIQIPSEESITKGLLYQLARQIRINKIILLLKKFIKNKKGDE